MGIQCMKSHHVTHKEWLQADENGLERTSYGYDTQYDGRQIAWVVVTGNTEDDIERIERDMERCREEIEVARRNIETNRYFQTKNTVPFSWDSSSESDKSHTVNYHFDVKGTKKQLKAHNSEKSYWTKKLSNKEAELKKLQCRLRAEAKFLNEMNVKVTETN